MGQCRDCQFYRKPRPASAALFRDAGGRDTAMTHTLQQIAEDEHKALAQEAMDKIRAERTGSMQWSSKPKMSAWCAQKEAQGVHEIPEIKNAGAACGFFKPGPAPNQTCRSCAHVSFPRGNELDGFLIAQAVRPQWGANLTLTPRDPQELGAVRQSSTSAKATEVWEAYFTDGHLPFPPRYLQWCGKRSDPEDDDYVICAVENVQQVCTDWQPSGGSAAAIPPAPQPPSPPRRGFLGWRR
jgi:hypothetical protein